MSLVGFLSVATECDISHRLSFDANADHGSEYMVMLSTYPYLVEVGGSYDEAAGRVLEGLDRLTPLRPRTGDNAEDDPRATRVEIVRQSPASAPTGLRTAAG